MTELITQNSKLVKTSKLSGLTVMNWGITANEDNCVFAGVCKEYCYAKKGTFIWSNVKPAFDWRGALSRTSEFTSKMVDTLTGKPKLDWLRIHDSGDYYSLEYILKWFDVMRQMPHLQFYSYTKAVRLFKRLTKQGRDPSNFTVIYSYGGMEDHLINPEVDRHAIVLKLNKIKTESKEEWQARMDQTIADAGYANASDNDLVAPTSDNHRIGLRWH